MKDRPCPCGSGKSSWWLHDAAGIPCCRVCDDCEDEKRSRYNPAIFDGSSRYAATGEEADIGADCYDDNY